jgi:DNA-binding transcriptional MerR regulator
MQTQVDLRSRHFFSMDISEVSKRAGLPASALRYYEERGLIASVGRQGLRRRFAPEVLEQLALISLGQAAGFSLDEISQMFSADRRPNIDRKMLASKADQIDAMITRMHAMSDSLRHAANCPAPNHLECPSFQRLLKAAAAGTLANPQGKPLKKAV